MTPRKPIKLTAILIATLATASLGQAQTLPAGVNPADIGKPPIDTWLTYAGDYNAQRFSTLTQINDQNVKNLVPAWSYRPSTSREGAITDGNPDAPPPPAVTATGGLGGGGTASIKSVPLLYNGTLYFTSPNHVFATNAKTGQPVWHFAWNNNGGLTLGNRGVGLWDNSLYFLTSDNFLLCLDSATGKELWKQQIANVRQDYWTSSSPTVIGNHVIYGAGTDRYDFPAFFGITRSCDGRPAVALERDPRTWRAGIRFMA